jgi:hypothetical protein
MQRQIWCENLRATSGNILVSKIYSLVLLKEFMDGVYINSMMPCSLSIPGKVIGFSWLQPEQDGTIYLISFDWSNDANLSGRSYIVKGTIPYLPTTCNHTIRVLLL